MNIETRRFEFSCSCLHILFAVNFYGFGWNSAEGFWAADLAKEDL